MPGTVCLISVKQDSDATDVEEESSDTPAAAISDKTGQLKHQPSTSECIRGGWTRVRAIMLRMQRYAIKSTPSLFNNFQVFVSS